MKGTQSDAEYMRNHQPQAKLAQAEPTPGPYEVVESEIPGEYLIYADESVHGHIAEIHGQNAEANSKLFVQAWLIPEMVERLEEAHRYIGLIAKQGLAPRPQAGNDCEWLDTTSGTLTKVREAQG